MQTRKGFVGFKHMLTAWFGKLIYSMMGYGFKQVMAYHILFYKKDGDDITLIIVYFDDMIVTISDFTKI